MNQAAQRYYDGSKNIWGLPQKYKSIDLYPIRIVDEKYQKLFYELFFHPKNFIQEKEIIKMSYLKFLIYVIAPNFDIQNIEEKLSNFLKYVTKQEDIWFELVMHHQNAEITSFDVRVHIGEETLSEFDFSNIREIILEQNGSSIEYVEEYNPNLEKHLEHLAKRNETTFEDEITIFCSLAGMSINQIEGYTLYQFHRHFHRLLLLENYRLYQPLLTSGQVEIKSGKGIEHYSSHVKKYGRYENILFDAESIIEKNKDIFSSDAPKS